VSQKNQEIIMLIGYVLLLCMVLYVWIPTLHAMPHGVLFRVVEVNGDTVTIEALQPPMFVCRSSLVNYAKKGQVIHCHTYSPDKAKETGHSFFCEGGTWNLDLQKITYAASEQ
jgi:hypothetical protein